MKRIFSAALIWTLLIASSPTVLRAAGAPLPGGNPAALNAAMLKLFAGTPGFTAKGDVRMLDKRQQESASVVMDVAHLEGKMRAEIDMKRLKSKDMPPEAAAMIQQLGLDRVVAVLRPDRKANLIVYPTWKAYAEIPMTAEEIADIERGVQLEKTRLGKETLDGHPCEKNKVTITNAKGERHQALMWNATDLKDFPIKLQIDEGDSVLVMQFRSIKMEHPAAIQFEAPAGFTRYDSAESLMQMEMLKRLGGGK